MNELSLFTGAGGGVLGSILLGHRIIGYVENNEYCQRIIRQRIDDGIIDEAPILGDIRAFNHEGYAGSYTDMVDVVSGGFPCQDISCAGKGAGITGERSGLWFEMAETVRIVRPRYVFIENSPALVIRGLDRVLCGLAQMGYDAAWGIISAADVGAPHLRKRIWILANATQCNDRKNKKIKNKRQVQQFGISDIKEDVADTPQKLFNWAGNAGQTRGNESSDGSCEISDTTIKRLERKEPACKLSTRKQGLSAQCSWWQSEPELGRVADWVANRVDRLSAIGNGQVPLVAATAFRVMKERLDKWAESKS